MLEWFPRLGRIFVATALVGLLTACASLEAGRYGVSRLTLSGMDQMQPQPLRECLVTHERKRVTLRLGVKPPKCDEPPFERSAPELRLWTFAWSEWPSFNRGVFDRDLERILRWYRARGFYGARIERVSFDPPEAAKGRPCRSGDCRLEIGVWVHEGPPVLVDRVDLLGIQDLSPELRTELEAAIRLKRERRFDESDYDQSKTALLTALRDASFAGAKVSGRVEISTRRERARVRFTLRPGKRYRVGVVRVTGHGNMPEAPIREAAGLSVGEPYRPERLEEARDGVRTLGAFSSVTVEEKPDDEHGTMDVTLRVVRRARDEVGFGIGVMSGTSYRSESGELNVSIPQWDVHLFGRYERRHIFNTLGAFSVDVRPRLIFGRAFPDFTTPDFGNIASVRVTQPGLIEAKTNLLLESTWDYGPDPFLGFDRSDLSVRLAASRGFFKSRLFSTLAIQQDAFVVDDDPENVTSDGSPTPESYRLSFLEQELRLDLRDQTFQPTRGAYVSVDLAESPRWLTSDWTSLRVAPEVRSYVPLVFESVFAARLALGAVIITDASDELDELSRRLGPSSYRLRGGGSNSVRGFLPGELGVGSQGGIRRWETMLEWRVRLGSSLTTVLFLDFGDVNDEEAFRFSHLNTSTGLGLRYFTFLGPLRLDAGFRIPAWATTDGSAVEDTNAGEFPFTDLPGALHLTIGDSF
jgi:outer membrane translocation and assembly module TamA